MPSKEAAVDYSRRRSQRLLLQVPVVVRAEATGGKLEEATHTLVVNAHGALIALEASVQSGETLLLRNKATGEEQPCRVVYLGPPASRGLQVGMEFIKPAPQFWQISFPPQDWS